MLKQGLRLLLTALTCWMLLGCEQPDYYDTQGNSGRFKDHHGRWMIINYWATWCKPCIEEIPELNRFSHLQRDKVTLFAVDFDQSTGQSLIDSGKKLGIEFSILTSDPATLLAYQRPTVLPTTLIFNPNGQLHRTLLGPQTLATLSEAIGLDYQEDVNPE